MMEIDLGHFLIRDWRRGDEETLARHANNPKIWLNVHDRFPHPYTLDDAKWWIEHASSENPMTSFAIVVDGEAAGGFAINDDSKAGHGIFGTGVLNPPLRIIKRIRMWKAVAHIAPDLRIISVARERLFVAAPPVTNQEVAEIDFHHIQNQARRFSRMKPSAMKT